MKFKFLLLGLLLSIFINAQNAFELINTKKAVIPFKFINNLIFIPININGAELTFLLDTGVSETILFSLEKGTQTWKCGKDKIFRTWRKFKH
ncbi:hypothetical protein [Chryseobacterium arthrosphaerae]|uniref:hypothetical protein n=1 Tax=Chryseobacterium arthrosphaerae TaxID=651561 RepID=UPI0024151FB8|nr:hypothetical protein [Chryseobacterium arthrosphaerae]MDG4652641.1 hypothetical protein [Chryseobacterium arthrosphaerae]